MYVDVNECDLGIDTCEHNCYNTEGSYKCDCDNGYQMNDGHCSGKECFLDT